MQSKVKSLDANISFEEKVKADIFLYGIIERVVFFKDSVEDRKSLPDEEGESDPEDRGDQHEDPGNLPSHDEGHDKGKDQHDRTSKGEAHQHHIGHLHIRHIRRHPGHEGGGLKVVDILKGKILNPVVHVLSQIFRKARGSARAVISRLHTEKKREHRHNDEKEAEDQDRLKPASRLDLIDEARGDKGDDALQDNLSRDHDRREDGGPFILPDRLF